MTKIFTLKHSLAAAGIVTFGLLATSFDAALPSVNGLALIASANAAEGADSGHKGQGGQKQGGSDRGAVRGSGQGGRDVMMKGQGEVDEDSDRPIWAGVKGGKAGAGGRPDGSGTAKGDLYGDLWIILRDENGEPILSPEGFVQPIDADGNLIPLDAEGAPLDPTLVQEVEFSRLSVSRAPSKVLTHSLDEAIAKITTGTIITLDAAGRIVIDGATIDSPLENLALYKAIMTDSLPSEVADKLPADLFAASLLAASADKTSTINVDVLVYLNTFVGVNTVTGGTVSDYYDFTTDYSRYDTYKDATATVLVLQDDGVTYVAQTVNIYDAVFSSSDWIDPTPDSAAADDFAAAANDALRVIQFVHDNEVR